MLLAANPANAHVELLQAGKHQSPSISHLVSGGWRVIGGSEGVVVCGQFVRSLNDVKMF
jgi:hypothetical protein